MVHKHISQKKRESLTGTQRNLAKMEHERHIKDKEANKLFNKYLEELRPKYGSITTFSDDIHKVGKKLFKKKFIGVFASDTVPHLKNNMKHNQYCIFNVDKLGQAGSHWVATAKDIKSIDQYVFDSYGRQTQNLVPLFKPKYPIKDTDYDPDQTIEQIDCGLRCLAWLMLFDKKGWEYARFI